AREQPGLYTVLCRQTGIQALTPGDTQTKKPHEALAQACTHLMKNAAIPQIFDAILIDEGQDLMVDPQWKYLGKQPFYWLAYQALRPISPTNSQQRRLTWADDETQSLASLTSPHASELWGEDLGHLVTGNYSNGSPKTAFLKHAYRTPAPIVIAAQALGMGWLRPGGMVTGITYLQEWQALGYQVKDNSSTEQGLTIYRSTDNSPHPLTELWQGETITCKVYRDRQQELTALASKILHNLRYDGLRPSQEILVIILGTGFEALKLAKNVAQFLIEQGIDIYIPSTSNYNQLQAHKHDYRPNQFWFPGAVTISRIHRAKGQEADMVYLVGLEQIAQEESNPYLRNQLLIALTRTRGWVDLSGIGSYPFYEEIFRVLRSGNSFTLNHRYPPQREITLTSVGELLHRYRAGGRNFQNADLSGGQLHGVNLSQANLIGANLKDVNLHSAQLQRCKLAIANLQGANLMGANLQQAQLMGANLRNANLAGANLTFADLTDADTEGAHW
ncbi:MAG: ATP-binding domain-containing protein, partial [Okeania sp. SIO2D1]|nr:ATP-binding domain-containing protein [Okeania sp. SIO2D1]